MEKKTNGRTMLLVASILLLIGGIISFLSSVIGIAAGGYFASVQGVNGADSLATLFLVYFITCLVMAAFQIVASIYGIANRKKPEKSQVCLVMGIILVILAVLSILLSVFLSNFTFTLILSLILPLLYVGGAIMNRPGHQN